MSDNSLAGAQPASPDPAQGSPATSTGPEQTPSTPADSSPAPAASPDGESPRNGARERIEELAAQNRVLREGFDYLRQQLGSQRPAQEPAAPAADPRPTLAQFEHDAERFESALADWSVREAERRAAKVVDQRLSQAQEEQRLRSASDQFTARSAEFKRTHADYDVIVGNPALPFNGPLLQSLMDSEHGPAIAYHLGQNPDKAIRIARGSPLQIAAAIGRLEAEVTKPTPPPKVTGAPPPPTPVGSGPALGKAPEQMSAQEYLHWRLEGRRKK